MSMNIFLLFLALAADAPASVVNFDNDIIPVLTKAGCNTGACHGAAVGRGGFRLSLYGSNPAADYQSIARELEGRRINLAHPDQSLFVLKPTESIEHGGGTRLEYDGVGATLLEQWVEQGAVRAAGAGLKSLSVQPAHHVVEGTGTTVPLRAFASFDDGREVEVTRWTVFTAEDPAAVQIATESGVATVSRRGRHIVIARYLDRVVPLELLVPLTDAEINLGEVTTNNYIDEEVLQLLATLRIPVSPPADDAAFLRRIHLDLTGRLPAPNVVEQYLMNPNADKRARIIDALLESDEFTEYWTLQLSKLLRIRSQPQDSQGAQAYHSWLREQLRNSIPYDAMARQLLTSVGDTHEVGPANFFRTVGGPREQAEFTSELFMGSRLRCANCHDHPLDRWTQDDYHGLAAIFSKLERGRVVKVLSRGEVIHPNTGEAALPRVPGERYLAAGRDGRQALAEWLTSGDNPYFAKAFVNRLWKAMMGRGLVEPTDDFRDTNPATHPLLLDRLAVDFVEHHYDLRHLLRRIAQSAAYARSSQTLPGNEADDRFYSHALTEPLEPEVLADAITDVLGLPEPYGDEPVGTRAVSLFDGTITSDALDILGRCSLETSCESDAPTSGGLPQKLHMINGSFLNRRLSHPESRLQILLNQGAAPLEIVENLYLSALGRRQTPEEMAYWQNVFEEPPSTDQHRLILQDLLWSLLNCREFITNH